MEGAIGKKVYFGCVDCDPISSGIAYEIGVKIAFNFQANKFLLLEGEIRSINNDEYLVAFSDPFHNYLPTTDYKISGNYLFATKKGAKSYIKKQIKKYIKPYLNIIK